MKGASVNFAATDEAIELLVRDPRLSDQGVIERVLRGETALFEILIRRLNQRLYRIVRMILQNDWEVEDVMQETYVIAYSCLHQFAGRAKPGTWVTRIAINLATSRARRKAEFEHVSASREQAREPASTVGSPEELSSVHEVTNRLEQAIDILPERYRLVFVMREIEQLDTAETAACLGMSRAAVKVRLYRAKAMLRALLETESTRDRFRFRKPRCDRIATAVLRQIWLSAE